ncbi:MAG: DUF1592 domain-containing protein [Acidobacteria bacterium]|nr:DUF1592 domain-containing protein [Acidobacteriota bacterium]
MRFLVVSLALAAQEPQALFRQYCVQCHNAKLRSGGVALDGALDAAVVEPVIARLRARSMPPPGNPRPSKETFALAAKRMEDDAGRAWHAKPNPGRIGSVHRLTRFEYANAIRDLLALDVDVQSQLPGDETADGSFDNFADSLTISTSHLERYLSVARQVSRLAVGIAPENPGTERFPIPLHVLQDDRQSEDLPLGSRGGMAIRKHFPVDGEYVIRVRLQRQYQDYLKGMGWPQQLDVRVDGALIRRFTVGGGAKGRAAGAGYAGDGEVGYAGDPEWERYMQVEGDAGLEVRVPVRAGPRIVGVSFVREIWEPEGLPQPAQRGRVIANDQVYMGHANVGSVQISGPFQPSGRVSDTPSRRAIFSCTEQTASCAETILSRLARHAYRRPVTATDVRVLMGFFRQGATFEGGIQYALERLLVDPDFLLRIYREPPGEPVYRIRDLELASRLSFFLWGSIPDETLLRLAERGELSKPEVLTEQTRRMLADERATRSLIDGFTAQWLNLRRVPEVVIDPIRYPSFDLTLLQSFQKETELFVASTITANRDVRTLLNANYTFVNERLARHYGIPGIQGSRFRRVTLAATHRRGGLLGHGALLAATSYPDRTSPVLRGKWLLNNLLGVAVPAPPAGLDTSLQANDAERPASIRERLERHRKDPACNSCHSVMDPLGFALEDYDVIGAWRTHDESGRRVETREGGLEGLRAELLEDPEQFPRALTEKLLAYALGRRVEAFDRPAVREIVRGAAVHNYNWSSIILGIVHSPPFLMRTAR